MHSLENIPKSYALLELYINNSDSDFIDVVTQSVEKHNNKVLNNDFPDAGFDLHFPGDEIFNSIKTKFVSMDVMCQMKVYNPIQDKWVFTSYYLYPRSSLCKTPLSMANHVGIIDSGYRGRIMVPVDIRSNRDYFIDAGDRLFQLVHPSLKPISIEIVKELDETERGSGGFGSTGK